MITESAILSNNKDFDVFTDSIALHALFSLYALGPMQKVLFKEACVSFSSQTNYINNKNKLPGTISALHCSVEPEVLHKIKKNYSIEYLHTISGHFGVVNLAAESCLVKLQLRVAVSNVAN